MWRPAERVIYKKHQVEREGERERGKEGERAGTSLSMLYRDILMLFISMDVLYRVFGMYCQREGGG
jgi:hypothetical protein